MSQSLEEQWGERSWRGRGRQNLPRDDGFPPCEGPSCPKGAGRSSLKAHSKRLGLCIGHHTTSCPLSRINSVTYMPWQMGSILWPSSDHTIVKSPYNCVGENSEDILISKKFWWICDIYRKLKKERFMIHMPCFDDPPLTKMYFLKSRIFLESDH